LYWKRILNTLKDILKYSSDISFLPDGLVEKVRLDRRHTLLHQENVLRGWKNDRMEVFFAWIFLKNLSSAVETRHSGLLC